MGVPRQVSRQRAKVIGVPWSIEEFRPQQWPVDEDETK